jgi:tetratricopeptide (TPR) repeat protein
MKIKLALFILLVLLFNGCSQYYKFDELYDKGDFIQAYTILNNIKNTKNGHYQKRLYRVVTKLALDGDSDFINKLKSIVTNEALKEIENYARFAATYNLFLEAKNPQAYSLILSNLTNIHSVPDEFLSYAYKLRGVSYYKVGHYQQAIEDLNASFKIAPYADNLYFIGMCYYGLEDQKSAENYFNKTISTTQNGLVRSLAYFQLGEMSYYQKKYSLSLDFYLQSINSYSQAASYSYKIAKSLQKLRYNRLSTKFNKISLRIQKDYANAWFSLNIN